MEIQDYLKSILVTKNKNIPLDSSYAPYMMNRFLSFLSPQTAKALNDTVNTISLDEKSFHHSFLISLFPKLDKVPWMQYVKKKSKKKESKSEEEEEENTKMMAEHMEMSTREIKMMKTFAEN